MKKYFLSQALSFALLRKACLVALLAVPLPMAAQSKKSQQATAVYSGIPSEYTQVGTTAIYQKTSSSSIDVVGQFGTSYYSSTYANGGYRLAICVGTNSAVSVDCASGTTTAGVTCACSIEQQGELARICYTVTNTNDEDVTVSLGTHADVMIGSNDAAPISRRKDTQDNTYGLTMKDGNGAQLCILFGSGLNGVTAVDDFWFGYYYLNNSASAMVGNYSSGNYYMVEDGSYDSGMGWCWKDRLIAAGETKIFSYLIGVGDVNLEPSSDFVATPDDPEMWNDLSVVHQLTLEGHYESPAGVDGRIEYAVEDSEEWIALTEMLPSGSSFTGTVTALFDATQAEHKIRFRTVDNVGNTSILLPIVYKDVSFLNYDGITDLPFTGDSLFQTGITADLDNAEFVATHYLNNVHAGTATFHIEGVFPSTIGRKACTFTILPAPLAGGVTLEQTAFVYNASYFTPGWAFTTAEYAALRAGVDYTAQYSDNRYPGTATLTVTGKGDYTGTLTAHFHIDKASLTDSHYRIDKMPEADISYDGLAHAAVVTACADGMGEIAITYAADGVETADAPAAVGRYEVYLTIGEGTCYYGMERTRIGSFAIYHLDDTDWSALVAIAQQIPSLGWDVEAGAVAVGSFAGVTVEEGRVVSLDLSGRGLEGGFPMSLLALTALRELDLSDNLLTGDIGAEMAAAAASGSIVTATLTTLDISHNGFSGNAGALAACLPALTELNASYNHLSNVYPAISAAVTTLDLGHQTIDEVFEFDLSHLSADGLAASAPSILFYDHVGQNYNRNLSLLCATVPVDETNAGTLQDWWMVVNYSDGQLGIDGASDFNIYYGASGDTLHVLSRTDGSTVRMRFSFAQGDANFDGAISILDLQSIILMIFERYPNNVPFNFTAANVVDDEQINVQDVVVEVNMLLANEISDTISAPMKTPAGGMSAEAVVYLADGVLTMTSDVPVAAFDIIVNGVTDLTLSNALADRGFTCATRATASGCHIVGYSLTGGVLPAGSTEIATLTPRAHDARVVAARLSDDMAQPITTSTEANASAIERISTEERPLARIASGQLTIDTSTLGPDVRWCVTSPDGSILASGIAHAAGLHTIGLHIDGIAIITLTSASKNITQKIIR